MFKKMFSPISVFFRKCVLYVQTTIFKIKLNYAIKNNRLREFMLEHGLVDDASKSLYIDYKLGVMKDNLGINLGYPETLFDNELAKNDKYKMRKTKVQEYVNEKGIKSGSLILDSSGAIIDVATEKLDIPEKRYIKEDK